jgi:hypothetical protein
MAAPGKKAGKVADQEKFEPKNQGHGGAITSNSAWRHYAEHLLAPLRRT